MTDQLTEEEEKAKSLNKLKNKQEAIIADLEGNFSKFHLPLPSHAAFAYAAPLEFDCSNLSAI